MRVIILAGPGFKILCATHFAKPGHKDNVNVSQKHLVAVDVRPHEFSMVLLFVAVYIDSHVHTFLLHVK